MLQIKKLKRPTKKSGKKLLPRQVSEWKKFGVTITNITGDEIFYIDSVSKKKK